MRSRVLVALAAGLLAGCFTVRPPSLAGVTDIFRSAEWEYRQELDCRGASDHPSTIASARTEMMNRLGKQKWELVSIETVQSAATPAQTCSVFTFKRRAD
jgi:hypothetical protein